VGLVVLPRPARAPGSVAVKARERPNRAEAPGQGSPDRLFVGVLAGILLFYLLGRATGLGRR
jgi:hypothetical protein